MQVYRRFGVCHPCAAPYLPSIRYLATAKSRNRQVTTCVHDIKARWCIDIRYGVKLDAVALLQEWVADIGAAAGLTPFNTQISSGAIGVPESRLELEVAFDSMSDLEAFWAAIPPERHRAWSQRAQHLIIDGSPTWQVYRACAPVPEESSNSQVAALHQPSPKGRQRGQPRLQLPFSSAAPEVEPALQLLQAAEDTEDEDVVLDWKGDPMKINPGDKLPFF